MLKYSSKMSDLNETHEKNLIVNKQTTKMGRHYDLYNYVLNCIIIESL